MQTTGAVHSTMLAVVGGWRTASATRRGRGRTFFGPLQGTGADPDGTPNAVLLGVFRTATEAFVADSRSANGWSHGVLSTVDGQFRETTGVIIRDQWAVLRSRRQ